MPRKTNVLVQITAQEFGQLLFIKQEIGGDEYKHAADLASDLLKSKIYEWIAEHKRKAVGKIVPAAKKRA